MDRQVEEEGEEMKWLEGIKRRIWFQTIWTSEDWKNLDRLISIAEGAEWGAGSIIDGIYCPVCKGPRKHGHEKYCPYSDEYKRG